MKSLIIQPSHVRGLGNILDNEDNIQGLHCRVEAQDTLVEFDDLELKTYYMGTGTQLNIRFILDTISILPDQTVHVDVLVTDDENNPVSGVDLYIYERDELISQMETGADGYGVEDGSLGFNFTSEDVGKHTLKCVIPRQDLYYESKNELVINVLQETTLTLTIDPDEIDTLTDTITLYGTLLNEEGEPVVGEIITFYDNATLLGWSITNDLGVATLVVNIEDIQDLGLVPYISIGWTKTSDNPNNHTEDGSLYVSATISDTGISGLPLTILVNNTVMFEGVTDSTGHADLLDTTLNQNAVVTVITKHTNLYNATTKQYRLGESEKIPTITSLSVSSSTVSVGTNVTFTATVTDEDDEPIEGLTVTFKDGGSSLGTGTTNSSGVATLTSSGLAAGNHSITAVVTENSTYAASTSSAVSLTVNNHSYSLAFSQASYAATGGSATLSVTLLDNNVPVEGATISVSGSDSSLYTGITNNNGVASVTVSVSAETTFTATYQNVSDTCTVTVGPTIIFQDDCSSSSGLTNYGNIVSLEGSYTGATLTYNSTENAYAIASTGNGVKVFPITALNGLDSFKLTMKIKGRATSSVGAGIACINATQHTGIGANFQYGGPWETNVHFFERGVFKTNDQEHLGTSDYTNYYTLEMTVDGYDVIFKWYDPSNNLLRTETIELDTTSSDFTTLSERGYGLDIGWASKSSYPFYIKDIVVISL